MDVLCLNDGARRPGSDYLFLRFGNPSSVLGLVWAGISHLVGSAGNMVTDVATVVSTSKTVDVYKANTLVSDVIWA